MKSVEISMIKLICERTHINFLFAIKTVQIWYFLSQTNILGKNVNDTEFTEPLKLGNYFILHPN